MLSFRLPPLVTHLRILPQDLDFVCTGLPVEERLHRDSCPFCTARAFVYCSVLFRLCGPPWGVCPYPVLSLTTVPGVPLWKVTCVLSVYRCVVVFGSEQSQLPVFLQQLHPEVAKWFEMPPVAKHSLILRPTT